MARLAIDMDFLDDYSKLPKPIRSSVKTAIDKFAEHVHAGISAFQAHGDRLSVSQVAVRLAATTAQPAALITQTLLDDRRAVLSVTDKLLFRVATECNGIRAINYASPGRYSSDPRRALHGRWQARSTPSKKHRKGMADGSHLLTLACAKCQSRAIS